jgi:hypothetical protein
MLVYGDAERLVGTGDRIAAVAQALDAVAERPAGLDRHAALVSAFLAAAELVQGVADAECEARGRDAPSEAEAAGMAALVALAREIDRSWSGGFAAEGAVSPAIAAGLGACRHGAPIRVKAAEGHAFYALYPETYLEAARRSGLGRTTRVIGIRSIGTGLSALVAAALGAPLPVTVRPRGHPFRREIVADPALAAAALGSPDAAIAVVDEGPGLSGSSFGAVADWLEGAGIRRERLHFFPSHDGDPGPHASPRHRASWRAARRFVVGMDALILAEPSGPHRLHAWVAGLVGSLEGPLQDISGGAWRALGGRDPSGWPAADVQQERRKFLARARGKTFLVKFAGLGEAGPRKLGLARRLSEAGFTPPIVGLRHGFLVERWIEGARTLRDALPDRDRLVERLGAYLAFRAGAFPAAGLPGATLAELRRMAVHNAGEALGGAAAQAVDRRLAGIERLEPGLSRVVTDNRLQAHEWLLLPDGRMLKTDAVDHSAAHDLVGCQDIAWDVAGAVHEFGLSAAETDRLGAIIEGQGGVAVDRRLLAALTLCYPAFRIGACTMAAQAIGGEEAGRLEAEAARHAAALAALLAAPPEAGFVQAPQIRSSTPTQLP